MKRFLIVLYALLLSSTVVFFGAVSANAEETPTPNVSPSAAPRSSITDGGEMLTTADAQALTAAIAADKAKYGLSFAVETVPSLNGQKLETVSLAHAKELGVGDAGKDNGVLIFISRDDHKIRFELGRGVSNTIPDSKMTDIISSQVSPKFKTGNYLTGIEAGMTAVGDDYVGTGSHTPTDLSGNFLWVLIGIVALAVLCALGYVLYLLCGKKPRRMRKKERERKESSVRLTVLKKFVSEFKYNPENSTYKALPNEAARLAWLDDNHADIAEILRAHYPSKIPTTNIIDRSFYSDTNSFFTSFFGGKSSTNAAVMMYKLTGEGFENLSIDEANKLIQIEKEKYVKEQEKYFKKKERARKIWESIPEPTRKALKKAKSQSDRVALLADDISHDFITHYSLISSMFLASSSARSSSSGHTNSGHSSSSSSSSSYSSPSSYDSGNYGGGSFDGGGGSGGW